MKWVSIDERNNSSPSRFNKLDIRRSNVRDIGPIFKPTRGAISRMAENSDNRTEIEGGIRSRATWRWRWRREKMMVIR